MSDCRQTDRGRGDDISGGSIDGGTVAWNGGCVSHVFQTGKVLIWINYNKLILYTVKIRFYVISSIDGEISINRFQNAVY